MDSLKYTFSKSYAFTWVCIWLVIFIAVLIRLVLNYPNINRDPISFDLMAGINLVITIVRYLIPALNAKTAIEINEDFIITNDEKIAFTIIDNFVLYDSGVIAVITNGITKIQKTN